MTRLLISTKPHLLMSPCQNRLIWSMWLLLINPSSGNGRGRKIGNLVKEELQRLGLAFLDVSGDSSIECQDNLKSVLASNENLEGLFLVGGDGTINIAAQELVGSGIGLALIPAGTGNDFARTLNLRSKRPGELIRYYLSNEPALVDVGKVNDRYFVNVLSTGFDSMVNERANAMRRIKGRAKYNISILLVLSTFKPRNYRFLIDSRVFQSKAMLIAVSNGISYGGGMKVTPDAKINDGLFDILILTPISRFEFLRVFPKVFSGRHTTHPAVQIFRGKNVEIDCDAVAYADGERVGPLPIKASAIEGGLLTWRM
ncbi:MAG: YegS/Rv2252/BmrU family lipid kinase [Actinobacteria bacterium]|nr:YegS/Rv2252/BmrU family lipid kinase [Actinomycetota bacterium]